MAKRRVGAELVREREDILTRGYSAFNSGHIGVAAVHLASSVKWPNEIDGGWEDGPSAVVDYWHRLFRHLRPSFTVIRFEVGRGQAIKAVVDQEIRDSSGNLLAHQRLHHLFTFRGKFITRMRASSPGGAA